MNSEAEWRKAIRRSPDDATLWLAYADWLEEKGDLFHACQAREKGGRGRLVYRLTHPSWGGETVGEFAKLHHLKQHLYLKMPMSPEGYQRSYHDQPVPVGELQVVVEWVAQPIEVLRCPYSPDLKL